MDDIPRTDGTPPEQVLRHAYQLMEAALILLDGIGAYLPATYLDHAIALTELREVEREWR